MSARKALLVGIDGLRIDDALAGGHAPVLAGLADTGGIGYMRMEVPTISGPGWASILTGAAHAEHGVFDNTFRGHTMFRRADVLSQAYYRDQSTTTFAASSWPPLVDPTSVGPVIATRQEQLDLMQHGIIVRDGEMYGYRRADAEIAATARKVLRDLGPDLSFVYLGEVDEAGHTYGGVHPEYDGAVERVDTLLGVLVHEVADRAARTGEDWLVAVTTDHGHLDSGGHGGGDDVLTRSFLVERRWASADQVADHPHPALPAVLDAVDVPARLLQHLF